MNKIFDVVIQPAGDAKELDSALQDAQSSGVLTVPESKASFTLDGGLIVVEGGDHHGPK